MNKKLVLLSVVAAVALGAACVLLIKQLQSVRERERAAAAAAQAEAAARAFQEDQLKEAERSRARVEKQNKELTDLAQNLRESEAKQASNAIALAERLKAGAAAGAADSGAGDKGLGDMFQKMFKDPAMKEMIRSQQKASMKMMYGSLFKELNLDAEQQKKLTDLIIDAGMAGMDTMGDMFQGDAVSRSNAVDAVTDTQKKLAEEIKAFLGEEKYAQYEDYQKTLWDRMTLNQFQQQSAGTETALRDDQMKQLVQLMKEERGRTPPIISEDPSKTAENMAKIMDSAMLDRQFQWQEEYNKRIYERAGQVLSPAQLKEFAEYQEQQLNMQKFGLKMAREMFGGGNQGGAPAAPVIEQPAAK